MTMQLKGKIMMDHDQSGFSIIEVLISIVVLGIGIMAISLMQAHFAGGNSQSRQMIRATDIAVNHIETLNNITNLSDTRLSSGTQTQIVGTYERDYTLSWTVTDNGDGTLSINVSVSWNDGTLQRSVNFPWVKSI